MNKKINFESQFLDYIENDLSASEREAFDNALHHDKGLRDSFEQYQKLLQIEETARVYQGSQVKEDVRLSEGIMFRVAREKELEARGLLRGLYDYWNNMSRPAIGALATAMVLIMVVKIGFDTPKGSLRPEYQENKVDPTALVEKYNVAPLFDKSEGEVQMIPPGYRAVEIEVPERNAVSGWVSPGSKVDVHLQSSKGAPPETISRNAKVLATESGSIRNEETSGIRSSEVTVIVPEGDARRLELAQQSGSLSLTMRGDADLGKADALQITIEDLLGRSEPSPRRKASGAITIHGKKWLVTTTGELIPFDQDGSDSTEESQKRLPTAAEEGKSPPLLGGQLEGASERRLAQPFQQVAQVPLSTFSADVDTGSYSNMRRYIKGGSLPPASEVRTEEFLNAFTYSYPKPVGETPFSLAYELARSPFRSDRFLLKVGVQARDVKRASKGYGLVFLVDVSGSMNEPLKLSLVKNALSLLTQELQDTDEIALVTYSGTSRVVLPRTSGSQKSLILSRINSLRAGGSTNGESGIEMAYDLADGMKQRGLKTRVIMATDGDFNVGMSSLPELLELIRQKREGGTELTVTTFGSKELKDPTMEQLANQGNGNYYYLDSYLEAQSVFQKKLLGTLETVAFDVKFQVEFNPQFIKSYRQVGYENRSLQAKDFTNDAIDGGEIGSGHAVTVLYELELQPTVSSCTLDGTSFRYAENAKKSCRLSGPVGEIAFLKARYKRSLKENSREERRPIVLSDGSYQPSRASEDMQFASAVAAFGEYLKGERAVTLEEILTMAKQGRGTDPLGERAEFIGLLEAARSIVGGRER